jgi:signal transduction histidine kinase
MMVVFGNALIHVRFVPRILVTLCLAGALCIGYLLPHPEYLSQPMLPATLGIFGLACICSLTMGALHFVYVRQTFFQAVNLAQGALALKRMNSRLEAHVRAQTSELRQLASHIETVREEERRRIAQGLHDELGQELVAIRYAVALARRRCEQAASPVQKNLEQIDSLVEHTAGITYTIVNELRPRMIDDLGLVATIEWLLQKTSERYEIPCQLRKPEHPPAVDSHLSITLFRILQEALTNVIRHAEATRIQVDLSIDDERLCLSVRDNGIGFRPANRRGPGGIGLVSMRERAFAVGGTFRIERDSAGGTVVTVEIPLKPPQQKEPRE